MEAVRERIARSVPFVVFFVDRLLDKADVSSAEGRDRALAAIQPIMQEFLGDPLRNAALRADLLRRAAGRLDLPERIVESLVPAVVSAPRGPAISGGVAVMSPPPAVPSTLDRRERGERTFLALCVAFPREGRALLEEADLEQQFSSALARRAATHLLTHLDAPLEGLPADDPELSSFVSELDARAARGAAGVRPGNLEHAWLSLELARLERAIELARSAGAADPGSTGSISRLSAEREQVRTRLRHLSGQLQSA
jgi:DNA primase